MTLEDSLVTHLGILSWVFFLLSSWLLPLFFLTSPPFPLVALRSPRDGSSLHAVVAAVGLWFYKSCSDSNRKALNRKQREGSTNRYPPQSCRVPSVTQAAPSGEGARSHRVEEIAGAP